MGRPGCSSCCKITDPPRRADCELDNFDFYYELSSRSTAGGATTLKGLDYVDLLVKNQRTGPHEILSRVTQFIKKPDFGEYRTNINAFSWSLKNEFDVIRYDRPPNKDYLTDLMASDLTYGYFTPRKFNVFMGVTDWNDYDYNISITRELQLRPVELVSSGESYGIQDWQFTKRGMQENGSDPNAFPEGSVEKGCGSENTLEYKYDINVAANLQGGTNCVLQAARDGSAFSSGPRDRTNIQIKRITWVLGYEQRVQLIPNSATVAIDKDRSGPQTFFRGIPVFIQYQAFNFGEQLFVRGSSCSGVGCMDRCGSANSNDPYLNGWSYNIRTDKVLKEEGGQKMVEDFLEEYRSIPYCLTYPFLKMDDGTYWFANKEGEGSLPRGATSFYTRDGFINSGRWDGVGQKFAWGGKMEPDNMATGGPEIEGAPPIPPNNATLQPVHHWTPKAMTSIKVENEEFLWFNPYCVEAKFYPDEYDVPFEDTNGGVNGVEPGVGVIIGYEDKDNPHGKELEQWTSIFPDSKELTPIPKPVPVPKPAPGQDREAYENYLEQKKLYEEYVEEMIRLLLYYNGDPNESPIKGVSPVEGDEQFKYVKGPVFEFVDNKLKGNEYDIPQQQYLNIKRDDLLYNVYEMIFSKVSSQRPPNEFNLDNSNMWTKWHDNIIVVQVRSQQPASDWLKRTGVPGAKVRVDDEVYYPVGECNTGKITKINYDRIEPNKIVNVEIDGDHQNPLTLDEIELKKDTITYGIDGRVYRLWMWLESKLVDNEFESFWQTETVNDVPVNTVYKPLQHKIKNIYIENFERPTPVGPEVSSYSRYPTNDTRINLVTEISFKDLAEPRKVDNVEPYVLSIYDIAGGTECEVPVKPEQWMENFAQFDDVDLDYRETKVPFYYLDEEDEPFGRLLSDDKVLTVGKKERDQYIANFLRCPGKHEHWDVDSWMYYYPEGTAFKYWHEPELDGFNESCRNNPYVITAKHIFPKEGEQERIPYLENFEKSPNSRGKWSGKKVEFSFTQTPDRGYLFTTLGFEANDSWYRISFEFENILDWRQRTLEELRGDA